VALDAGTEVLEGNYMSDSALPKISIVTPSLNQGEFIETCIRSIMEQDYPNLEHIIIDGGSTDSTIDVLKKYPHVKWISEPDSGQSEAINKGMRMASGELVNWLCADDELFPGALEKIAKLYAESGRPDVVGFGAKAVFPEEERVIIYRPLDPVTLKAVVEYWKAPKRCWIMQPATYYKKELFERTGGLKEHLQLSMDYDMWVRFAASGAKFVTCDEVIAKVVMQPAAKSVVLGKAQDREKFQISMQHWNGALSILSKTMSQHFARCREEAENNLHAAGAFARGGRRLFAVERIFLATIISPFSILSSHFWHAMRLILGFTK